jgi:O-antigen ligase
MIRDHPILGVGYFNFAPYFQRYYPEDVLYEHAQLPHNIFVQVGTDAGSIGLIVYLLLIYRAFRSTNDVRRWAKTNPKLQFYAVLSKGFDTAFIGFLIAGQFVTVGYYPFMWIHLALVVCLRNVARQEGGASLDPRSSRRPGRSGTLAMGRLEET